MTDAHADAPTPDAELLARGVIRRYKEAVKAEIEAAEKQRYGDAARAQQESQCLAYLAIVACRIVGVSIDTLEPETTHAK